MSPALLATPGARRQCGWELHAESALGGHARAVSENFELDTRNFPISFSTHTHTPRIAYSVKIFSIARVLCIIDICDSLVRCSLPVSNALARPNDSGLTTCRIAMVTTRATRATRANAGASPLAKGLPTPPKRGRTQRKTVVRKTVETKTVERRTTGRKAKEPARKPQPESEPEPEPETEPEPESQQESQPESEVEQVEENDTEETSGSKPHVSFHGQS